MQHRCKTANAEANDRNRRGWASCTLFYGSTLECCLSAGLFGHAAGCWLWRALWAWGYPLLRRMPIPRPPASLVCKTTRRLGPGDSGSQEEQPNASSPKTSFTLVRLHVTLGTVRRTRLGDGLRLAAILPVAFVAVL